MVDATVRKLRFVALQLVGAVAVVHLVVGGIELGVIAANGLLGTYLTEQLFAHPRTLLFVLSGVAVLVGVVASAAGRIPLRVAYLLGVAVLSTYVVGWFAWHTVLDHGVALGGATAQQTATSHTHGGLVGTFVSHYLEPLAAVVSASGSGAPGTGKVLLGVVSKTLELAGIAVLLVLLRVDQDARGGPSLRRPFVFDRSESESPSVVREEE